MDLNRIINGMIRAIRLDKEFYEEVERDPSYDKDALTVVILVSALSAIGGFLASLIVAKASIGAALLSLIFGMLLAVAGFYLWSFVTHFVGTRFFKGTGERAEVQRALGFAYAPQALGFLAFIPCLGGIIAFAAWILSIATGFVATRQSLDQDNTNAALTMIVSTIVVFVVVALISAVLAALGLAGAALTGAIGS